MFLCTEKMPAMRIRARNVHGVPYHPIFCFEAGFEVVDLAGARFGLDILRLGSGLAPRTERMLPRLAKKIHQISLICLTLSVR